MRATAAALAVVLLSTCASADLKVMQTEDVVRLVNGEEIRGTVLAVGIRAVVVIVDEAEQIVPRSEVASIKRGEVRPNVKGYQTEAVEGVKVIVGEGFRDSEGEGQAVAGAKPKPAKKVAKKPARKRGGGEGQLTQEKIDQLMGDPKIRDLVNKAGGREKALGMARKYQNDPRFKALMQQILKTGKLPPGMERFFK